MNPYAPPQPQPESTFNIGWVLAFIFGLLLIWDRIAIAKLRAEVGMYEILINSIVDPLLKEARKP